MKNLSRAEIIEKGTRYDKFQNEGGEGYNPYWDEMRRREIEEKQKKAAQPKTKKEQIDALHSKINRECGSVAAEWDESVDEKKAKLYREIQNLEKEMEAEFDAEWTENITKIRRAAWNDFIRSLLDSKGQIPGEDQPKVYQKQVEQGWKIEDLKKAIKSHKL